MAWIIDYTEEASNDLNSLDNSQKAQVLKVLDRVALNPLPSSEGGYGKPLGNKGNKNLTGYMKIKLLRLGIRVVYKIVKEQGVMRIIVISVREDETVYQIALDRIDD